ncbi:MAG TPA: hypothetical protein VHO27_10470 [Angustibacter sp.]|nr:hypothetical protein [Angustibacter sp.]
MAEQEAALARTARAPRVVAVAVTARRRKQVERLLARVAAGGGEALLVTADGARSQPELEGVQRLDLLAGERRWGTNRLLAVDPVRVAARLLGRRGRGGASPLWRRWVASRPYRLVRYWVLWRVARQHLDVLRPDDVTHVLVVGIESWPITWHLLKASPQATVGFELPPPVLEALEEDA